MPYTTKEQVRAQLTDGSEDPDATAASLPDVVFERSIENMQSVIDGYLGGRYTLPLLEPYPEILETIATDLVAYDVTVTYYQQAPIDNVDPVWIRYTRSMTMLKDAARGVFVLDVTVVDEDGNSTDNDEPLVINPGLPEYELPRLQAILVREVYPPW